MTEFKSNSNMISQWHGFYCNVCGKHRGCNPCELTIEFNHGSKFDGEHFTMDLCGDCADWFMENLSTLLLPNNME